jgi:hypothetical protein
MERNSRSEIREDLTDDGTDLFRRIRRDEYPPVCHARH